MQALSQINVIKGKPTMSAELMLAMIYRECPTVEDLVSDRYLDGSRRTTDAWDTPFQISCEDGDIAVFSAGPDLEFNTEDDI